LFSILDLEGLFLPKKKRCENSHAWAPLNYNFTPFISIKLRNLKHDGDTFLCSPRKETLHTYARFVSYGTPVLEFPILRDVASLWLGIYKRYLISQSSTKTAIQYLEYF
jgi:hypothetical protein